MLVSQPHRFGYIKLSRSCRLVVSAERTNLLVYMSLLTNI